MVEKLFHVNITAYKKWKSLYLRNLNYVKLHRKKKKITEYLFT